MKGRVKWSGRFTQLSMGWEDLVKNPLQKGYYIEAFASADALIDDELQTILRQVYDSFESQHLINQLESVKAETKFFGTGILTILNKLKIVNTNLMNKVKDFKGKRNKVSHNTYAEYSLVNPINPIRLNTQEEYDAAIEVKAKIVLEKAYDCWIKLEAISNNLSVELKDMDINRKAEWLNEKVKDLNIWS